MKVKINTMKLNGTLHGLLRDIQENDVLETAHVIGGTDDLVVILSVRSVGKHGGRRWGIIENNRSIELTEELKNETM